MSRLRRLIPLMVLLALMGSGLPTAQADFLDAAGDAIVVPTPAWEDEYSYRITSPEGRVSDLAVRIGLGGTRDAYYDFRDYVGYELAEWEDGALVRAEDCAMLEGGVEAIRRLTIHDERPIASANDTGSAFLRTSEYRAERYRMIDWRPDACDGFTAATGQRHAEGDVRTLSSLLGTLSSSETDAPSAPAVAETFHGRAALRFDFQTSAGAASVTLADGLPAIARLSHPTRGDWELLAYATSGASPVVAPGDTRLPERDGDAPFTPYDRLQFDDEAYGLVFGYREAYTAALESPQSSLRAFLDAHPDAILLEAIYDRPNDEEYDRASTRFKSVATWRLAFGDADARLALNVTKEREVRTFVGDLTLPRELILIEERSLPPAGDFSRPAPIDRLAAEGAMRAADQHGSWAKGDFRHLAFTSHALTGDAHPAGIVELGRWAEGAKQAPLGEMQGGVLSLDLDSGAALAYHRTAQVRETRSALEAFDAPRSAALEPYRNDILIERGLPLEGMGLAVGGVALLALLATLAKIVAPFYTRLQRERLLDHPARAELLARIQREPGIRQHELLDLSDGGDGITRRHLDRLVKHGFVVQIKHGAWTGYYAAGAVPPHAAQEALALRSETARRVYEAYAQEPALSLREAGARLGVSAPSVHRVKKRLEAAGLLPAGEPVVRPASESQERSSEARAP